jgi:exo-beta-1,3-glucanase (GH17 family)
MYPTGTFNEFPIEGVIIAMGDELRKQLKDVAAQKCKRLSQDCQSALAPLLLNPDISTHTKRFVEVAAVLTAETIGAIVVATLGFLGYFVGTTKDIPQEVKFNHNDIQQIQAMAGAHTFAVVSDVGWPSTVTYLPSATATSM